MAGEKSAADLSKRRFDVANDSDRADENENPSEQRRDVNKRLFDTPQTQVRRNITRILLHLYRLGIKRGTNPTQ
jgi:hypothetical protein